MQLVPNQLVELHLTNVGGPQMFRTRIEDVYDDLLIVAAPLQQNHVVPIRVGSELTVEFKLQSAVQEGRFKNKAIVEKRFKANIPLLQLRLVGTWVKTQERMFVRVPVFIDAIFIPILDGKDGPAQTGLILNLSGGGFMLRSTYDLQMDDEVRIAFDLEKSQIVSKAQVARFIPTEEGHDFGFTFVDLSEQVRQNIIRFVFRRQIDLAEMTPNTGDLPKSDPLK